MSVFTANRLTRVLFVTLAVILTVATARADVASEVRLSSTELLFGEPLQLYVSLKLTDPADQTAIVLSERFLAIEVIDQAGNVLPLTPVFDEHYHKDSTKSEWLDQTIQLSSVSPQWDKTIDLDLQFQFLAPGRYSVKVEWDVPNLEADETAAILTEVMEDLPTSSVKLLSGYSDSWNGEVKWKCPGKETDSRAYELLAGGKCPEVPLNSAVARIHRDMRNHLLEQFPTSAYAGYWLDDWHSVPYGRFLTGDKELITYLGSGRFLDDHPAIMIVLGVPKEVNGQLVGRETVDTRERIESHQIRLIEFISENPRFQSRDSLEMALAYDVLALGDAKRARVHWRWVAENSPTNKTAAKAEANIEVLERSGFLDR